MKPNDTTMQHMEQAIMRANVDYCEIRFEHSRDLEIGTQGQSLDNVGRSDLFGGNIRALHNGGWGFAVFSDLADLPQCLETACAQALIAGTRVRGASNLAPVPIVEDDVQPNWTMHPQTVSLEEKTRIMDYYHQLALNCKQVTSVRSMYRERCGTHWFANSEGTKIRQEKVALLYTLMAAGKSNMHSAENLFVADSAQGFEVMLGLEDQVRQTCALIPDLLQAQSVESGAYTVICSPSVAATFVHESLGHLSEADEVIKNPDFLQAMHLGRQFAQPILNIYDSGEYAEHLGSFSYDDEGVASRRTYLIREGKLAGRLHSRASAAILNEEATGNARAVNYTFPPLVRMRNTAIEAGSSSFEEMLQGIELGIYLVGNGGGQTNGENFTFSIPYGFMIHHGKICELVRDLRFSGNVFTTLNNIDMVGNDPQTRGSNCGKWEQNNLFIGTHAPHIRIQKANIGGVK